jgi:hypothetical protein
VAIFGIGAYWDDKDDMVEAFFEQRCACIGWSREEAPTLYEMLQGVRIGSIVYLKSFNPNSGLRIKAVGIVDGPIIKTNLSDDSLSVAWIWTGEELIGQVNDKYSARTCTIYEEHNPNIQARVVALLLATIASARV